MRKLLAICACPILLSLFVIPRSTVYSQMQDLKRPQRYADDQILVKFKTQLPVDEDLMAQEIVRAPGVRTESLNARRRDSVQLVHLNQNLSVEEAVSRAQLDPRVEYAEPDYFVYASDTLPNDAFFSSGQMWGLSPTSCIFCDPNHPSPSIDAPQAWDITRGSDDIVAVVLDTGVDLQHEDLAGNAWNNPQPGVLPGFVDD
ncbi:MAG: hypothetical protein ABJB97_07775, partial [Acidobacteriota bacterium]